MSAVHPLSTQPAAPAQPGPVTGRSNRRRWAMQPGSLRGTVVLALLGLLLLATVSALATRHLLAARVHDYAILNLAGQLREIGNGMALDGRSLLGDRATPPDVDELARYRDKLLTLVAQYDRIVQSFVTRELAPDLTGLDEPVSCSWDAPSLKQLSATRAEWLRVRALVEPALRTGADAAAVLAAAAALEREGPRLLESSRQLAGAFKEMMQGKLDIAIRLQFTSVGAAAGLGLLLWWWLRRRVLRPLADVERGAEHVLDGALGHQTPEHGGSETRAVAAALNRLSARMRILFELAGGAGAGLSTTEMLQGVLGTLRPALPLDLVAVVRRRDASPAAPWRVERVAGADVGDERALRGFEPGACLSVARDALAATADIDLRSRDAGLASVLSVVLRDGPHEGWIVVFAATRAGAFAGPAAPLLRAAATLVGAQLDRTLSTEALVVAAVEGLAKLAESRDPETGDHLVRMSRYSALIAEELAREPRDAATIDARYVEEIERFAPMHDIGKVGIADAILLKPGRLSDDERAEMSRHPLIGAEVLRRCEAQMQARGRSVFRLGIEIAEGHHEKWDGSGYPHGRAGTDIPLSARIVALADVFDALTSRRPYKEAWSVERALEAIRADSGRHFDPAVVAALERALPAVLAFYDRHKHV